MDKIDYSKVLDTNSATYSALADRYADVERPDRVIEGWAGSITEARGLAMFLGKNPQTAFEFGTGAGFNFSALNEVCQSNGGFAVGVELALGMHKITMDNNPDAYVFNADVKTTIQTFGRGEFDLIQSFSTTHCIPFEHAIELYILFRERLKKDGRIILSTPMHKEFKEGFFERDTPRPDKVPRLLRWKTDYNEPHIYKLADESGLQIDTIASRKDKLGRLNKMFVLENRPNKYTKGGLGIAG